MDRFDCNIIVVFVLGVLNRGDHMDRFDLIEVTTWRGLTNIIVMFVLGVLNRGDHMDKFDCNIIEMLFQSNLSMWSPLLSQTCPCGHLY
jgi:hypothetical protein